MRPLGERAPQSRRSPLRDHEARRVTRGPGGLVRIKLKKPFSDGTVAVTAATHSSRGSARKDFPGFKPAKG